MWAYWWQVWGRWECESQTTLRSFCVSTRSMPAPTECLIASWELHRTQRKSRAKRSHEHGCVGANSPRIPSRGSFGSPLTSRSIPCDAALALGCTCQSSRSFQTTPEEHCSRIRLGGSIYNVPCWHCHADSAKSSSCATSPTFRNTRSQASLGSRSARLRATEREVLAP